MQQTLSGTLRGDAGNTGRLDRHSRRYERPEHGLAPRVHVPRRSPRLARISQFLSQSSGMPSGNYPHEFKTFRAVLFSCKWSFSFSLLHVSSQRSLNPLKKQKKGNKVAQKGEEGERERKKKLRAISDPLLVIA